VYPPRSDGQQLALLVALHHPAGVNEVLARGQGGALDARAPVRDDVGDVIGDVLRHEAAVPRNQLADVTLGVALWRVTDDCRSERTCRRTEVALSKFFQKTFQSKHSNMCSRSIFEPRSCKITIRLSRSFVNGIAFQAPSKHELRIFSIAPLSIQNLPKL
jgi:hypothetical protein